MPGSDAVCGGVPGQRQGARYRAGEPLSHVTLLAPLCFAPCALCSLAHAPSSLSYAPLSLNSLALLSLALRSPKLRCDAMRLFSAMRLRCVATVRCDATVQCDGWVRCDGSGLTVGWNGQVPANADQAAVMEIVEATPAIQKWTE
eukprot:3337175-Rhodomonas_salina.2